MTEQHWSATPPAEPGYWWWRCNDMDEPQVVRVSRSPKHEPLYVYLFHRWSSCNVVHWGGEWCGPIRPPGEG